MRILVVKQRHKEKGALVNNYDYGPHLYSIVMASDRKEQVRTADQNCQKNFSTISVPSDYVPEIPEIMVQLDSY